MLPTTPFVIRGHAQTHGINRDHIRMRGHVRQRNAHRTLDLQQLSNGAFLLGSRMNISYPIAGGSQKTTDNRSPTASDSSTRFHRQRSPSRVEIQRSTARSSPMNFASQPQSANSRWQYSGRSLHFPFPYISSSILLVFPRCRARGN